MSFLTTSNFIKLRGIEVFYTFYAMLVEGKPLREIADELNVSISRTAQLKDAIFERKWVLKESAEHALRFHLEAAQRKVDGNEEVYRTMRLLKATITTKPPWKKHSLPE